jgi:hypothetical protein
MAVLALVVQDGAGTNLYLGHRSVLSPQIVFRLSQLVHARLQGAAASSSAEADRGALVLPGELAAYRTQYRRVHEAMLMAVTLASAGRFDGSGCLTDAARVLLSACRSQRSQTVTVRELLNKKERLADELEKCLYGEKGLGAKQGDGSRNWTEVRKDTRADESLRQRLGEVDFELPESLLSVARKQNVPPQTPSRKSGRDLWTLTEDSFVPSLHMPPSSAGEPSSHGEGHSHSETHTNLDASDAHSEISWDSATTASHPGRVVGSGAAPGPRGRSPDRRGPSDGGHSVTSRTTVASGGSDGGRSRSGSGSTATTERSHISVPRAMATPTAKAVEQLGAGAAGAAGAVDVDDDEARRMAKLVGAVSNSPGGEERFDALREQAPPPPTPPQAVAAVVAAHAPASPQSSLHSEPHSPPGVGIPTPEVLRKEPQAEQLEPEPEPQPQPQPEPEPTTAPEVIAPPAAGSTVTPRCQVKLIERVAAVLVNGQPTKFTISGQIAVALGPDRANAQGGRVSMRLREAQHIAGETLQWSTTMAQDTTHDDVFHCELPPQPAAGGTAVLLSYKAIDSFRKVPLSVRAKWGVFKQEQTVTIDLGVDPALLQPLRNLRIGAQMGGTAPISRSIRDSRPADGSVSLGPGRWLLAKVEELAPGATTRIVIGFKGQGHNPEGAAQELELPAPTPIMVVFESVGALTGLDMAAAFVDRSAGTTNVPVLASFEAMPKWYRCHDC